MCLKTIFALLAPKKAALFGGILDTPHGKPLSEADGWFLGMSGPAQITAPQSRLDHAAWLGQMQATYNLPEQNPARLPLYRRYKATRWNGEKQALARQAHVLTHKLLSREFGKPVYLEIKA